MDPRSVIIGLIFVTIWASAFTSARVIVAYAPPVYALAIRFWISGALAVGIARALGQDWHLSRRALMAVVVFGVCQNAIYLGLNFVAMQWVEASLASIIAATMPLMVAALGWAALRERVAPLGALGLALGVIGVAIIMGDRLTEDVSLVGVALCFLGALSLAVATLMVKGASGGGNLLMVVGLQMLVAAVLLSLIAPLVESFEVVWSWQLMVSFWYTVLFPGIVATWVWFVLVGRIGAVRAATYHFLTPVIGVATAAAILGEELGWTDALGVAVVAAGIYAVQVSKARRAAS